MVIEISLAMYFLLLRNLGFHWRSHVAVALGVAVGTAVLTGALLVGDTLRGSLHDLTLARLGGIDAAVVSDRFYRSALAAEIQSRSETSALVDQVTAAIILRGSVVTRDADNRILRRVNGVQVVGVERSFWRLFAEQREFGDPSRPSGAVLVNEPLARELGAAAGRTTVEIRMERPQAVPADSLVGRPVDDDDSALVVESSLVSEVLPLQGSGRFTLAGSQQTPLTVYVELDRVQRRLAEADQLPGAANVLLASARPGVSGARAAAALNDALHECALPADLGLSLRPDPTGRRYLSLETSRLILEPAAAEAALRLAHRQGWEAVPTLTYLANLITREDQPGDPGAAGALYVPYSTVTGLDPSRDEPWGPFLNEEGRPWSRPLREHEILLNAWAADQLWPLRDWKPGVDRLRLSYFVESVDVQLREETATLTLAGVVQMDAAAADPGLTPDFPGSRNRASIQDWKPPFPRNQWFADKWIRPRDNQYWRQYRAAPKAFVAPSKAQELWRSRHGQFTSIRFGKPPGRSLAEMEAAFQVVRREFFRPEAFGLKFQPVKEQGLASVHRGAAEWFGWLFLGFSFLLIVSSAMLVGLLFRLNVERRAKEIGLLLAEGYSRRQVRRLLLTEGAVLSLAGSIAGLGLAVAYASFLVALLGQWWGESLQAAFLRFELADFRWSWGLLPYGSLVAGGVLSLVMGWAAIALGLRGLSRFSPRGLLQGQAASVTVWEADGGRRRQQVGWLALVLAAAAGGLATSGFWAAKSAAAVLFFGSGAALLAAALAGMSRWITDDRLASRAAPARAALLWLGSRNVCRNPGRSLLTTGLLAAAVFLLIAVQAFRKSAASETGRDSGVGGFALIAEADVPLPYVPDGPAAFRVYREAAPPAQRQAIAELERLVADGTEVIGFRLRPGDDVSCLNLQQPLEPRILGVPDAMIERGGFVFGRLWQPTAEECANPWRLLRRDLRGEVPVLADDHAADWVLRKKVGETWTITDEQGRSTTLRLVGLLKGSIFQGELLIAEADFARLFPSRGRYGYFLLATPCGQVERARSALEIGFGLNVSRTVDRLSAFHAVENTYITTFQALGGLGLLLGTLGLAVVLLRNVWERRGELAMLRALGYSRAALGSMVLGENVLLIVLGLAAGTAAALVAIAPHLIGRLHEVPWIAIGGLLLLVAAFGSVAGLLAVRVSLRAPLLPALRRE